MEDRLIDNQLDESPKDVILGIMRWWEKKRLLFNLIILGIVVITVGTYLYEHPHNTDHIFNIPFVVQSLFYFIFINICYCAGWGIQLLTYYYFKIQYDSNALDYVLFVIGTLFTAFVTSAGYLEFVRW